MGLRMLARNLNFARPGIRFANLLAAITLAALATPIVKWLVVHGGAVGISNPAAISFCNILFVGNFLSGIVVVLFFGWRGIWPQLRAMEGSTRGLIFGNLLIGTVAGPIFLYMALETTTVTNLVLITRIDAVVYTALGFLIFRDSVSKMNWLGLSFILIGACVLVLWQGGGAPTRGDGLGILAGTLFALGSLLARLVLKSTDLSVFIFIRNLSGSVVFFCIALVLYGPHHFMDAFAPNLWVVMFVYAAVVVVLGDLSWFKALATVSSSMVASWSTMTPVLGIFFAFALLGEIPDLPQVIAAVVIVGGMGVAQIKRRDSTVAPRLLEKALAGG